VASDSSRNAADPFPVDPPLNFEDDNDNDDDNDTEPIPDLGVGDVTGQVAGEEEVGGEDVFGNNLSLPLECILYYNDYTFEEVMEFILETLADGVIGYQGHPTDKFLDGEFILGVACISKNQSGQSLCEKHHPVCPLSKDYHKVLYENFSEEAKVKETRKEKGRG